MKNKSIDPKEKHVKPPFQNQTKLSVPGYEKDMNPEPDFGEKSYIGAKRLEGKSALITGGDSGIGRAVAVAFAKEGAEVLISYLNEDEDAEKTRKIVEAIGKKCVVVCGDIQDESHCRDLINRAVNEFGKLDILINNAAYQMSHPSIEDITTEEFDRVMKTNIYAMFYLCKYALPIMERGGSIINTSSIQAFRPSRQLLHYAATKGAIYTFTKALAEEALERGIRVNAVAPGPIWTPLIPSTMPKEKFQNFGMQVPMKRPGQPVEVASAYVFLASNEASYITAQIIGVTGGEPLM